MVTEGGVDLRRRRSTESERVSCSVSRLDDTLAAPLVDASVDPSEQNLDYEFSTELAADVRCGINDVADAVVLTQPVIELVEKRSGITAIPNLHKLYADLHDSDDLDVSMEASALATSIAYLCQREVMRIEAPRSRDDDSLWVIS